MLQDGPIPRYARGARFEQENKRVPCTEGTGMEILHRIYDWFKGEDLTADDFLKGNTKCRIF